MGCARLRLLPKTTGTRAIVTLSKRQRVEFYDDEVLTDSQMRNDSAVERVAAKARSERENGVAGQPRRRNTLRAHLRSQPAWNARFQSTNAVLNRAFCVLKYEHGLSPDKFGAGISGLNEIFPLLLNFLHDLRHYNSKAKCRIPNATTSETKCTVVDGVKNKTKLYFASVDIHRCYDNIDQTYLYNLVEMLMSENEYLFQKSSVLHPVSSTGKVQHKAVRNAGPPEDFANFPVLVDSVLAQKFSRCIFVDGVRCSVAKKSQLLSLLREHLFSHMVVLGGRSGPRFLSQTCGIAQGSILSTHLCNYYYGNIQEELLNGVFKEQEQCKDACVIEKTTVQLNPPHLLVRIVDDFLLVTTDKGTSTRFLNNLRAGIPRLGVHTNNAKTRTSYDTIDNDTDRSIKSFPKALVNGSNGESFFAWCGMLFDTNTCEVRIDYARFAGDRAVDALTVERVSRGGAHLPKRMKSFIWPRCQPILFDFRINTRDTVIVNFYQMMLLCAVKSMHYISGMSGGVERNVEFFLASIEDTISYAFSLICSRLQAAAADISWHRTCRRTFRTDMTRYCAHWLGKHAFRTVLKERNTLHVISAALSMSIGNICHRKLDTAYLTMISQRALREFDLTRFNLAF